MQDSALSYLRHGQTPFFRLPASREVANADVAVLGVPHDGGTTYQPGARLAPYHVRRVSALVQSHHPVHGIDVFARLRCVDGGNIVFPPFDRAAMRMAIEAEIRQLAAAQVMPVVVGGDHSITLPILEALGAREPLGLVHIDAHCDTGGPFEGSKFHHGGPFRQAVLAGVLDPERTIQIGIRGGAEYLWEFSYASGMTVIHAEEFQRAGLAQTIEKIRKVAGEEPTYVSFDVDSLDPAYAPGTGTPEAGGLSTREAMELVRGCAGLDIVGGDVVEVAPQYDATSNTAQAGAQMLFEILALVALARSRRG